MTGHVPWRLMEGSAGMQVEWLAADGGAYVEPFFEQTIARLRRLPANRRGAARVTGLEELRSAPLSQPALPADAFIFHVSRCGSTLVAQMLAAIPGHVVLAEPPLLDDVLRLGRGEPAVSEEARVELLRGAVAALVRPRRATCRRVFVKLDSWHLFDLPVVRRAFPGVPFLFVHRHPVEVLVSLLRRPSLTIVRDTVSPAQLGLSVEERDELLPAEHAAAVLGAFFREAKRWRDEFVPVGYPQLPQFVWEAMPGCEFDAADRARLEAVAGRDAKNPEASFVVDACEKRRAADAATLAAAERWAMAPYEAFLAAAKARA